MKIAIVIDDLNIRGGTHKQVLRLCQYLKKNNIDFVLMTKVYDKDASYPEFQEFEIIHLYTADDVPRHLKHGQWFVNRDEDKKLYKLLPPDADIVNVHDNGLQKFINLAKRDRKKVVWQINDLPGEVRVGIAKNNKESFRTKIKRFVLDRDIKDVDEITVNVTKNKDRVIEKIHKDAKVFYCGVDLNEKLQLHQYSDGEKFKLLSMGVFFAYRNYETLVAVVKEMDKRKKPIHLDIIGSTDRDKEYSRKIADLIDAHKLTSSIKIWGQVDEETYANLFNQANTFAFVNIDQSWGLAVFEAMSCGLPVIVSNSVGATELLHNEVDSIIVEPTDVNKICEKLERLMYDEEYYNFISLNGMKAARSYTWDDMYCSRMLSIFKELEGKN